MQIQALTNHWILYLVAATCYPVAHLYVCFANYYWQTESVALSPQSPSAYNNYYTYNSNNFLVRNYLLIPFFTFFILPLADMFIGSLADRLKPYFDNVKQEMAKQQQSNIGAYDRILHFYVALQITAYLVTYWHCMNELDLFSFKFIMFAFSTAITAGISNIYAHELLHKLNKWDVFLARFLMTFIHFTHFATFHVHGHHKNVATELDPNTAKLNETVYHFIPRSAIGGFIQAWELECDKLEASGKNKYNVLNNKVMQYLALYIAFPVALYWIFGFKVLVLHVLVTITAISLTEAINYLEHYGLQRKKLKTGKYESIKDYHSWDCPSMLSGYFMGSIALHSDHHLHPLKPYEQLTIPHNPCVPVYKYDYAIMLFACLIPPLYRSIAHPILDQCAKAVQKQELAASMISPAQ